MDSKDLEVAGTFKVLGYELTLDEALTLQMNLSTALNISYGGQHEAPASYDTNFNDKWESVEEGVRGDGATETVSISGPDFDAMIAASVRRFGTVMAAGKEMDDASR